MEKEKNMVKDAARIQEKFDVDLFRIAWNNLIVGEKTPMERIMVLSGKSKENEEKLKNWYPGLKSPEHYFNVLLAQKTSVLWDMELRKFYKNLLQVLLILFLLIIVGVCFQQNITTQTLIISFIVPSLPLILHLVESVNGHKKRYDSLNKVFSKVIADIESYSETDKCIANTCRGYQDVLFLIRCDTSMIPDIIYKFKRALFDKTAKETNEAQSDKH